MVLISAVVIVSRQHLCSAVVFRTPSYGGTQDLLRESAVLKEFMRLDVFGELFETREEALTPRETTDISCCFPCVLQARRSKSPEFTCLTE